KLALIAAGSATGIVCAHTKSRIFRQGLEILGVIGKIGPLGAEFRAPGSISGRDRTMEVAIALGLRATARRRRRGMRSVKWLMVLGIAGCLGWAGREAVGQPAPAAPTYVGVERTIESIRQAWSNPGARPEPNADGWNALFNSLLENLRGYAEAADDTG